MSGELDLFRSFPKDGGLYRLHWAGRLVSAKHGSETRRVGVWLHKVIKNEQGKHIAARSPIEKDTPLLVFLAESMGSIPHIAIDTYWRDGRPTAPPFKVAQPVQFELSNEPWEVVRASDYMPEDPKKNWISRQEYCLFGIDAAGQRQTLYSSRLVVAKTKCGMRLLIPTYEIFRAYYAGCSELALKLVEGPFSQKSQELGRVERVTSHGQTTLEVEVADHIGDIVTRYLALLLGTPHGSYAASNIYLELLQQSQARETSAPWIVATLPFPLTQSIKLGVCGKLLGNDRFLVYRIAHSPFPDIPLPIVQVKNKQYIPLPEEREQNDSDDSTKPRTKIVSVGLEIDEPSDAKKNKKAAHIDSVAIAWEPDSLPKIEKQARQKQYFPRPSLVKATIIVQPTTVSVGNRSSNSSTPRASISPEGIEQIVSRFGAFHRCLQKLMDDKLITGWNDYALVRKHTVQGRHYCSFIEDTDAVKANYPYWPAIFKPSPRSRLAWVVQIHIKGKEVYWLEIEPRERKKAHYALVFIPKEKPLKETVLERLLSFCAASSGRLPQFAGHGLEDALTWVRARHSIRDDTHKPATALSAINRLLRLEITGTATSEYNDDTYL